MNEDFRDFLAALDAAGTRYLVVGAYAMAVHGVPRATGDLDVWIECNEANGARAWAALEAFGAPAAAMGISREDLSTKDQVIQIGLPPRRIDVLTGVTGLVFDAAWESRVVHEVAGLHVPFLGRDSLIANKRATGRARDRADLELLEGRDGPAQ